MKNYYLFVLLILGVSLQAQIITIPDANFKAALLSATTDFYIAADINEQNIKIDTNDDGEIQVSEALQVYSMNIQGYGISDLTGIELFANLSSLDVSFNTLLNIDIVQNLPLTLLICHNNQLTSINVTQCDSLLNLWIGNNQLTSIDVSQNSLLKSLDIYNNQISTIDVSQNLELLRLSCDFNQLTSLDVSQNVNLSALSCSNNQLTNLDVSQNVNLTNLDCSKNQLISLDVAQNIELEYLYCNFNQLTSLDVLQNPQLISLNCNNNQLTVLNVQQNINLDDLNCLNNQLTSLDCSQNTNLTTLDCNNNQLTSLDVSQNGLYRLGCGNNLLTSIEGSLLGLQVLSISNNLFTTVDVSQIGTLQLFQCDNNPLTTIDVSHNPNLFQLYCSNNSSLESINVKNNCPTSTLFEFSNNPNLQYICSDEEDIESVQYLVDYYGYTNCHINSYCSFVPGGSFYTIQGNTRYDFNNNGCDATDINIPNQKFTISSGSVSGSLIANSTGTYSIPVQAGTHIITPNFENPSYFTISPASTSIAFPTETSPLTQDFCVSANGIQYDVEVTIIPFNNPPVPGFDATYKIIYKNRGNQVSSGFVNLIFDDTVMDLVMATPISNTSATNSLTWNYTNLNPFETREIFLTFNINSPMETPAVNWGDVLTYSSSIVDTTNESSPNNSFTLNQTVVNAFDPNDKTCLEGATITPSMVGDYVHYVIRFENTGTFSAQNVVVTDVIDTSKFDIASLVPQSSSHSFVTRINSTTGKVEFIFENINLPFDDANNDGYVAFKIKTKSTLVLGNTFSNTANIYFDFNFPIVTNTATTTIAALSNQDFDFGSYFSVYPNPAKDVLHLDSKNEIGVKAIYICNTLGQMVLVVTNPENNTIIDVANLKKGTYFIKVLTDKGTSNTKFIKE